MFGEAATITGLGIGTTLYIVTLIAIIGCGYYLGQIRDLLREILAELRGRKTEKPTRSPYR